MRLPRAIRATLESALDARGLGAVVAAEPVGGGCIGNTTRLETAAGETLFLKWSTELPFRVFAEEAYSLEQIARRSAVRVPAVIALHDVESDDARWLLLEWLEPGRASPATWRSLAADLTELHHVRGERPGWPSDNFIGALPQANADGGDWPAFWRTRRLEPQLRIARDADRLDARDSARFDRLLSNELDGILGEAARVDGVSLLHGDLWSGNVHAMRSGAAALVDPACYFGHREVDLAMTELFGGFDAAFHDEYRARRALQPGYERRRAVYQLYYLLVHVNLFGGGYRAQTLSVLGSAGF